MYRIASVLPLVLLLACSEDKSPTSTSNPDPVSALDTSAKRYRGTFTVQSWDGSNWVLTTTEVPVEVTWRYFSYENGIVSGGYSVIYTNNTSSVLNAWYSKIIFADSNRIPIHEHTLVKDEFTLSPQSTNTRSGTFEFLIPFSALRLISEASPWGFVGFQP